MDRTELIEVIECFQPHFDWALHELSRCTHSLSIIAQPAFGVAQMSRYSLVAQWQIAEISNSIIVYLTALNETEILEENLYSLHRCIYDFNGENPDESPHISEVMDTIQLIRETWDCEMEKRDEIQRKVANLRSNLFEVINIDDGASESRSDSTESKSDATDSESDQSESEREAKEIETCKLVLILRLTWRSANAMKSIKHDWDQLSEQLWAHLEVINGDEDD